MITLWWVLVFSGLALALAVYQEEEVENTLLYKLLIVNMVAWCITTLFLIVGF